MKKYSRNQCLIPGEVLQNSLLLPSFQTPDLFGEVHVRGGQSHEKVEMLLASTFLLIVFLKNNEIIFLKNYSTSFNVVFSSLSET